MIAETWKFLTIDNGTYYQFTLITFPDWYVDGVGGWKGSSHRMVVIESPRTGVLHILKKGGFVDPGYLQEKTNCLPCDALVLATMLNCVQYGCTKNLNPDGKYGYEHDKIMKAIETRRGKTSHADFCEIWCDYSGKFTW